MGYIGRTQRLVCGGLILAAVAPAAGASAAALPGHPVGVTAATCEVSTRLAVRPYRKFDVAADRANCVGMLATHTLQPATSARISGRAVPNSTCGWKIRNGRLTLTVSAATLEGPWTTIAVPFAGRDTSTAAPIAGTSKADHESVGYSGLVTVAAEPATERTPPRCAAISRRAVKVSVQLTLSTPVEEQRS